MTIRCGSVSSNPGEFTPFMLGGGFFLEAVFAKIMNSSRLFTGFETQCSGLSLPFCKGDNLHEFMKRLDKMLVLRGMDTIAYIPDLVQSNRMRHIVKEHTRFTLTHVKQGNSKNTQHFDPYDMENDTVARMYECVFSIWLN